MKDGLGFMNDWLRFMKDGWGSMNNFAFPLRNWSAPPDNFAFQLDRVFLVMGLWFDKTWVGKTKGKGVVVKCPTKKPGMFFGYINGMEYICFRITATDH